MGPQPSCRPDDAPRSIDRSVQYCSRRVLRKPAHPTMERCKDRHCRRGAAALLFGLRRPGAVSPRVILAPEDLARPVQPAGFFFAIKPDTGRTDGGRRGSRRGYRATSLWGHPNENPGTKRSTVKPRRRRDSGKLAGKSIQAEGYPMAGTAAERISEFSAGHPRRRTRTVRTEKRIDGQRSGTALAFSAVAPWERPEFAAHPIQHSEFPHPEYRILNSSLSGLFRQYLNLVGSVAWKQRTPLRTARRYHGEFPIGRVGLSFESQPLEPVAASRIGKISGQCPSPQAPVLWPDNTRAQHLLSAPDLFAGGRQP